MSNTSGYVIVEANPAGKSVGADLFPSYDEARSAVNNAISELKTSPENYEQGQYSFLIKEAHKLDDGTLELLETMSRHQTLLGPGSGAQ